MSWKVFWLPKRLVNSIVIALTWRICLSPSNKAQETFNVVLEITNTNPVTHLEFDISEMLGDADALSFGIPSVVFGEAYRHDDIEETQYSDGKLIHLDPIISSSGEFHMTDASFLNYQLFY